MLLEFLVLGTCFVFLYWAKEMFILPKIQMSHVESGRLIYHITYYPSLSGTVLPSFLTAKVAPASFSKIRF